MKLIKIHEDQRGEINLLEGLIKDNKEVSIFKTKKGYARGGCIHNKNLENFVILEGVVRLHVGEESVILIAGESTFIPVNTSHYFIALEDSITIEWGCIKSEKKEKHIETRKIVERLNDERGK